MPTWDANQYLRFHDERTRPCRELAARVNLTAPRRVIDLGCGPGNSTQVLAERWPAVELTGFDSSVDMIAAARKSHPNRHWQTGDISEWSKESGGQFDLVFSNAAIQWVDDHGAVLPKLLGRVAAGGAFAFQAPGNLDAPAHRIMRDLAKSAAWRERFPRHGIREWHVHDLPFYYDALTPVAASLDLWETEYQHILPDANAIVEWYKGTGLRPFLDALASPTDRTEFLAAYLEGITPYYPVRPDGRVLFPFRRLFLIAYK